MTDSGERGDDPGIKLSVQMMLSNGESAGSHGEEGRRGGHQAAVALPKVSSPTNKSSPSTPGSPKVDCQALAQKLSVQAVSKSRQDQWGLLTAVSDKARKRTQGCHIMLHNSEHVLGRIVAEVSCQFESPAVSGRHCTITRRLISFDGRIKHPGTDRSPGDVYAVFVKDSSSNGTFINKEKLKKNGMEVRLRHGDIISLVSLPELENSFAFVFREVFDDSSSKRKGSPSDHDVEVSAGDGKRIRGTGKNAVIEGPVSLDDVRRLQRSNEELRQQLEAHVLDIEKMRGEFRAAEALHLVELKDVRAAVTEMHVQQIEDVRLELMSKSKELEESTARLVQQQTTIEDLNHRLASAAQSRVDAEEAILSHTSSIAELKKRLEDEFGQRQKDRAEWESNLEAAVERTRLEAAEELKRQSEASGRLQKQQQDTIVDLQEADKENRRLADSLRMKLEAERQSVIKAEEKGRRIGVQLQEERLSTENACKKATKLEEDLRKVRKELETEKAAKESAGAKVSNLELAMETAIRDLTLEKQRLQGARERIVLRETQLRAFYSTAEQVEALQQIQQQQLKVMLRTLEDEDGEGDYTQSRLPKTFVQSDGVENEPRMVSLACKKTSSPIGADQQTGLLGKDKDFFVHPGIAAGKSENKKLVEDGDVSDQKGRRAEPDWMDGDTQQEDEDGLVVSNFPSSSKARMEGAASTLGVQNGLGERNDKGAEVPTSNAEDTQLLEHGLPAATQLLPDALQDTGSGEVTLKESTAVRSVVSNGRRKSSIGVDATTSVSGGFGGLPAGVDAGSGGATMDINDDLQEHAQESVGAAENEGVPPVATPVLNVGSKTNNAYQDAQFDTGNNEATICTEDLLTSEVLGSWAFGTQEASVHADNEAGSLRNTGGGMSIAAQDDTQLEEKENEGTMCTDDLLASEVAGSWAVGTPPSAHGDNDSMSSDERNQHPVQEGTNEVADTRTQGSRPRPSANHILLEEVLHFGDPVNSQSSLSPATTNPVRNERNALTEMLAIVEPEFGSLHGLSRVTRHQSDIEEDSTTDDEDGNENEEVNDNSDGSQPLSTSPTVSVR